MTSYLDARGIHYWVTGRGERYRQIHWSAGIGLERDGTTGQYRGAGLRNLEFTREDLYGPNGQKRIARRFSHLPRAQTLALLQGLLETDGGIGRGREICFTSTSEALAEGVRYQMLRLGVPTAGSSEKRHRERRQDHEAIRDDGSRARFNGIVRSYDIRIPAVPELAGRLNATPLTKRNWLVVENWVFSRVRDVRPLPPTPFVMDLKVEGDESYMTTSALAHNGGKRKGAVCSYLETWHLDIEEFLELRKNTGDDRRRTHDMNTANWVPDLFMKRVFEDGMWTLFSPNETPDLHDLFGRAFEQRYAAYEEQTRSGEITLFKRVRAQELWRKMLSMLFETGHPWITFKDSCNIRSPQQHVGVVHSSNLCTEITLNTSRDEIAVCNLGSVNLAQHVDRRRSWTPSKLKKTVKHRSTDARQRDRHQLLRGSARHARLQHAPSTRWPRHHGIPGRALPSSAFPTASDAAVEFADRSMEARVVLRDRGNLRSLRRNGAATPRFEGSLWSQGDTAHRLAEAPCATSARTGVSPGRHLDDAQLGKAARPCAYANGMRNSNVMAIAPTATIANIVGVSQSIEPSYQNLFVKSNLSGEFTVVNPFMVHDLKQSWTLGQGHG